VHAPVAVAGNLAPARGQDSLTEWFLTNPCTGMGP